MGTHKHICTCINFIFSYYINFEMNVSIMKCTFLSEQVSPLDWWLSICFHTGISGECGRSRDPGCPLTVVWSPGFFIFLKAPCYAYWASLVKTSFWRCHTLKYRRWFRYGMSWMITQDSHLSVFYGFGSFINLANNPASRHKVAS